MHANDSRRPNLAICYGLFEFYIIWCRCTLCFIYSRALSMHFTYTFWVTCHIYQAYPTLVVFDLLEIEHSHYPTSPLGDGIHGYNVLVRWASIRCPAAFLVTGSYSYLFYPVGLDHFLLKCCLTALSPLWLYSILRWDYLMSLDQFIGKGVLCC